MNSKKIAVMWYVALRGTAHADWFEFRSKLKSAIEDGMQHRLYRDVQPLPDRSQMVIDKNGGYIYTFKNFIALPFFT